MNPLLTTLATWFLLGLSLLYGVRTLRQTNTFAAEFASSWREEYQVRVCGRAVAASRNLAAAATFLAARHPEWTARFALAAAAPGDDFLPPTASALPPDATGRCRSFGPQWLVASPHLEHHDGQPPSWPNWVMMWGEGEEDSL